MLDTEVCEVLTDTIATLRAWQEVSSDEDIENFQRLIDELKRIREGIEARC